MNAVRLTNDRRRGGALVLSQATVGSALAEGLYRLEDGRRATQALSCVITPMAGDQVLVVEGEENFLVCILKRADLDEAALSVPRANLLALRQARVEVNATERAALRSARDLELTAAGGTLSLNARNLFTTVADSLVENVRHYVGRFGQYLMDAKGLVRLHGEHALVTAEKDFKVDAERISLG